MLGGRAGGTSLPFEAFTNPFSTRRSTAVPGGLAGLELWGAWWLCEAGFGCWGCPKAGCAGTVLMDGAGPTLGLLLGAAQCPRGALGGWSCRNLVIWPLCDGNLLVLGTGCVLWSRWGCSERDLQQSCYQFWL